MKTKPLIKNTLFKINLGIVIFLSIGAGYFTIVPMMLWEHNLFHVFSMVTQNAAMISLWILYFASIMVLPLTRIIGSRE